MPFRIFHKMTNNASSFLEYLGKAGIRYFLILSYKYGHANVMKTLKLFYE